MPEEGSLVYGYTNEQLIKFGIRPRKSSKPPGESEAPPEQGLKKPPQSA